MAEPSKVRATLRRAAAASADLWRRLKTAAVWARGRALTLDGLLVLAMAPTAALLLASDLGTYVETYLFFEPVMKLRTAVDLQPRLDPSVRLVLLEDHSLQSLGRHPTFGEWQRIANALFDRGVDKAFLIGVHSLESEAAAALPRHPRGELVLGAVVVDAKNRLSRALSSVATELLVVNHGDVPGSAYAPAENALLPDPRVIAAGTGLGNLNILSNYTMPAAYAVGDGRLLPNMGLLAVDGLHWRDGHPENAHGRIPLSEDQTVYVDFVAMESILGAAVPISAFFDKDGVVRGAEALPEKLRRKLDGAKTVVLVPEAYTGARFVDSPAGKVPSYAAVVSLINSTLRHRFIYRPIRSALALLVWTPGLFLLLRRRRPRVALGGGAALTAGAAAAALAALVGGGWLLPCAQLTLIGAAGLAMRFTCHLFFVMTERLTLSKDLEMGQLIQRQLFPANLRGRAGGYEYEIVYKPYGAMAGDWYQIFDATTEAGEHIAILAIGDGVGKGSSAALTTAVIAGTWNGHIQHWKRGDIDVDRLVESLHRNIALTFKGEQNTTLSLAVLTPTTARFVSYAAPVWIHLKATDGSMHKVRTRPASPLGLVGKDTSAVAKLVALVDVDAGAGDVFLAYTDGVMDGLVAETRLKRLLKAQPLDLGRPDMFRELERLVTAAGAADIQPDDFTLVMIRKLRAEPATAATPEDAGQGAKGSVADVA